MQYFFLHVLNSIADDTQLYLSFHLRHLEQAVQSINSDLSNFLNISKDHMLEPNPIKLTVILSNFFL